MELSTFRRIRTKFIQRNDYGDLYCYKCKEYKSDSYFDIDNQDSCWFRDFKDRRCRKCKEEQYHKRRLNNRGTNPLERLFTERFAGLRDRAKTKNLDLNFSREYLKELWYYQEGKCALTGISMTYQLFNGRTSTNFSVDRIDSTKGYIKGNIQLLCMAINQMKSNLTIEELLYFCKQLIQKHES